MSILLGLLTFTFIVIGSVQIVQHSREQYHEDKLSVGVTYLMAGIFCLLGFVISLF